jgi:hypothetical protein
MVSSPDCVVSCRHEHHVGRGYSGFAGGSVHAKMSRMARPDHAQLPEIPLVDVGDGGALKSLEAERARADALLAAGHRAHGRFVMRIGDRISRAWLARSGNPFAAEILSVAGAIGQPGAVLLNLSYEWCCTTGAAPDPSGIGSRMLRVLDWRVEGLGAHVIVTREQAAAGPFYNVTWPGAVGVLTAMAPGRFAAAINQAPMRRHGLTLAGDWARNRLAVWRSRHLPPAHLLRQVFAAARDYDEAKAMLIETPLALPAFFTLSGIRPEQSCIVERAETTAVVHDGPGACANESLSGTRPGRARGRDNAARRELLSQVQRGRVEGFDWVRPPILNRHTRLAVEANAARGTLQVLGIEQERPATREFSWIHEGLAAA